MKTRSDQQYRLHRPFFPTKRPLAVTTLHHLMLRYTRNKCIDRILVPQKPFLYEKKQAGSDGHRVRGINASVASCCSDHAILCKGALSHILCVNCHVPRPVEQKATETHEWPGMKVKCIGDRLSPHSRCSPQLLRKHSTLINQQFWTTVTLTSLCSSSMLLCSAHLYFSQFYPSPSFSPLSPSLFRSLSFLLSQCNVIQD